MRLEDLCFHKNRLIQFYLFEAAIIFSRDPVFQTLIIILMSADFTYHDLTTLFIKNNSFGNMS